MTAFAFQLTVDTTTTCDFTPSEWTVATTSTNNAGSVTSFQTISTTGLFSAGPFPDYTKAGVYNVTVTTLKINGVVYGT